MTNATCKTPTNAMRRKMKICRLSVLFLKQYIVYLKLLEV
jgi:hypothetical protein